MMTLLGIAGLSKGTLLEDWVNFLHVWLGWGDLLVVLFAGVGAVLAFRRSTRSIKSPMGARNCPGNSSLPDPGIIIGNQWKQPDGRSSVGWADRLGSLDGNCTIHWSHLGWADHLSLWILMVLTALGLWHPIENWLLRQGGVSSESGIWILFHGYRKKCYRGTILSFPQFQQMNPRQIPNPGLQLEKLQRNYRRNFVKPSRFKSARTIYRSRRNRAANDYRR